MLCLCLIPLLAAQGCATAIDKQVKLDFFIHQKYQHIEDSAGQAFFNENLNISELEIAKMDTIYLTDLKIGSRRDKVTVQIDMDSSSLFIPFTNERFSVNTTERWLNQFGVFHAAESESFVSDFLETERSESSCEDMSTKQCWGYDTILFDSVSLQNISMCLMDPGKSNIGTLGLMSSANNDNDSENDNTSELERRSILVRLKEHGLIEERVITIHSNESHGSITIGPVENDKYEGKLSKVPLINYDADEWGIENESGFYTVLNHISLATGSDDFSISNLLAPVLLDFGATISTFPSTIIESLSSFLSGQKEASGLYTIDCEQDVLNAWVNFGFSGVTIKIPLEDMVARHEDKCYLMLRQQIDEAENLVILGNDFLRHAFVVYDPEKSELSLAQARMKSGSKFSERFESPQKQADASIPQSASSTNSIHTLHSRIPKNATGPYTSGGLSCCIPKYIISFQVMLLVWFCIIA